jgi:hypothetical protein
MGLILVAALIAPAARATSLNTLITTNGTITQGNLTFSRFLTSPLTIATTIDIAGVRELASMLIGGGASHEPAVSATILRSLADSFLVGVLAGMRTTSCSGNMFGGLFEGQRLRTADIEETQDSTISIFI